MDISIIRKGYINNPSCSSNQIVYLFNKKMEKKTYARELQLQLPENSFSNLYKLNSEAEASNFTLLNNMTTNGTTALKRYTVGQWGFLKKQFKFTNLQENIFFRTMIECSTGKLISDKDEAKLKIEAPDIFERKKFEIFEMNEKIYFKKITLKYNNNFILKNYELCIMKNDGVLEEYQWRPSDIFGGGWTLSKLDNTKQKVLQYKSNTLKPANLVVFQDVDRALMEVIVLSLSFIVCHQNQKGKPIKSGSAEF